MIHNWIASPLMEIQQCGCDGCYCVTCVLKQCPIKLKEWDGNGEVRLAGSYGEEPLLDQSLCEGGAFARWEVNSFIV